MKLLINIIMCDRDNEISLNKQVKCKDLKIMLVKIMKYAVIYFMIYTSPNEIQVKTGQLTCYFQHRCCTRDIRVPFQMTPVVKIQVSRLNFYGLPSSVWCLNFAAHFKALPYFILNLYPCLHFTLAGSAGRLFNLKRTQSRKITKMALSLHLRVRESANTFCNHRWLFSYYLLALLSIETSIKG